MKLNTLIVLITCAIFFLAGCKKNEEGSDKCKGTTCQNGGTCVNGSCSCPAGFEGTNCGTLSRAKFLGTYSGIVKTGGVVDTMSITITISEHADKTKLNISGLKGPFDTLPIVTCNMQSSFYCRTSTGEKFDVQGSINQISNQLEVKFVRGSSSYISIFRAPKK